VPRSLPDAFDRTIQFARFAVRHLHDPCIREIRPNLAGSECRSSSSRVATSPPPVSAQRVKTTAGRSGGHATYDRHSFRHGKGVCPMAIRKLRVYTGPEIDSVSLGLVGTVPATAPAPNTVRTTLGDILPLLADAVANQRTWLGDFADDELEISADLHDVLQAYRHFRRPGA
jgi:hypothetical protein